VSSDGPARPEGAKVPDNAAGKADLASRLQQAWRDAAARVDAAQPSLPTRPAWRDPSTWLGALVVMLVLTVAMWVVQIVNAAQHQNLDRFGLQPRHVAGLWGVLTQPFLHSGWGNLLSDTLPFLLIGWAVFITGLREWAIVSGFVLVVGSAATWLVAPTGFYVGASGVVFGWIGYLLSRAIVTRRISWIFLAVLVLVIFGALLGQLAPDYKQQSYWASHLCGFLAGVVIAVVLHPHKNSARGSAARNDSARGRKQQ
jgi:membrane associated rhomboid family serine protease